MGQVRGCGWESTLVLVRRERCGESKRLALLWGNGKKGSTGSWLMSKRTHCRVWQTEFNPRYPQHGKKEKTSSWTPTSDLHSLAAVLQINVREASASLRLLESMLGILNSF